MDFEEDVDEEDVELENTPLFQYMQECEHIIQPNHKNYSSATTHSFWEKLKAVKYQITQFIPVYKLLNIKNRVTQNILVNNLDEIYRLRIQSTILKCSILLEDDINFLENVESLESYEDGGENKLFAFRIAFFATACGFWKLQSLIFKEHCFLRSTRVILVPLIGYSLWSLLSLFTRKCFLRKSLETTLSFVKVSENIIKCSNKCLSHIRELEIYGRGLLLPVPEFSLSRIENSSLFMIPSLQLPKMCALTSLRSSVFDTLKKSIAHSRLAMLELIRSCPVNKMFDNEQNYIAFLNSSEITELLENTNVNNSFENGGMISSTSIKVLFQLCHLHLSEFLRRLYLCFCRTAAVNFEQTIDAFYINDIVLTLFNEKLQSLVHQLNESYKLQQCFSLKWEEDNLVKNSCINDHPLQDALRSTLKGLSLHLMASTARIHEINTIINQELPENDDSPYSVIVSHLQLIKQDMQASNFCLEESFSRLMKIQGPAEPKDLEIKSSMNLPKFTTNPAIPVIPLTENVDMASEDQVFEAYVDEDDNYNDNKVDYSEDVDRVEKRQQEVAKKMFAELKTILIPKAKEWKRREAKALGLKSENNSEVENSDSDHNEDDFDCDDCKSDETSVETCIGNVSNVSSITDDDGLLNVPCAQNNPFELPNQLIGSMASLVASRAKLFIQEDECYEFEN